MARADQHRVMPTRSSSALPEEVVGDAVDIIDGPPDAESTDPFVCGRDSMERGSGNDRNGDPLMTADAVARSQTAWCPCSCSPANPVWSVVETVMPASPSAAPQPTIGMRTTRRSVRRTHHPPATSRRLDQERGGVAMRGR